MAELKYDDFGRMFCKAHHKDYCHICCFDFRDQNRYIEEDKGLRQKRRPVDEAAEFWAICVNSLRGMERMVPRPNREVFEQNRQFKKQYEEKLEQFAAELGYDVVEGAKRKAIDKQVTSELDRQALVQEMARQNPGQRHFDLGGAEAQAAYERVASAPKSKKGRADCFTCVYCGTTKDTVLQMCGKCKVVSYCSRECQVGHWKAHKKECKRANTDPKSLPLTWEQVEAHEGAPVEGEVPLEVKVMLEESVVRQVFSCKDRVGMVRRVAAYTNSRSIPGLQVGSTLRWKNPRFHHFVDGSSGARIEEEDLPNLKIKT